nr:MAG TPA: hypothetical protein [Caudoviricetes sp.]
MSILLHFYVGYIFPLFYIINNIVFIIFNIYFMII